MNQEKLTELLRGKIDSYEKWLAVLKEAGVRNTAYLRDYYGTPSPANYMSYGDDVINHTGYLPEETSWWLMRESLRMHLGVYPTNTSVLQQVVDSFHLHCPYFPHLSLEDPNLVAYTPTMEDGLRDKQVRLSMGKFLRKFLLLATDHHIQRLEAAHRSELDPSFMVARSPEEIQRVYTTMVGDGGCMRYKPAEWGLPPDVHPSHIYAYEGLGVAYHEIDGRIVSRSVIYDNPADPNDKRYVRIYGDVALKRKLELAGYKMKGLQNVKIRAVDLHKVNPRNWSADCFMVAYLDGPGGRQEDPNGCWVYRIAGEDCLRVTGKDQAERLSAMGFATERAKSTDGKFHLPAVPADQLEFTCEFSGERVNILESDFGYVWHEGEVKRAVLGKVPPELRTNKVRAYDEHGTLRMVWMTRADITNGVAFLDGLRHGEYMLDDEHTRKACGYVLLDEAKYGAKQWRSARDVVVLPDGRRVLRSETILTFDAEGQDVFMLVDELDALRKAHPKDYVQVAPKGSEKAISHVRNPRLVTTRGKRRCVQDWHEVMELCDGTWDYAQNVRWIAFMGTEILVPAKDHGVASVRLTEEQADKHLMGFVRSIVRSTRYPDEKVHRINEHLVQRLRSGIDGHHFFLKGEMLFRGHLWQDSGTLEQMRAAVSKIDTMDDEAITQMLSADYLPPLRAWQHHAKLMLKLTDAQLAQLQPAAPATPDPLDDQLVVTAQHVRDERFAAAA